MPLCPENSYGLQVGIECGEIDSDAYVAARLGYLNDAVMDRLYEEGYRSVAGSFEGMIKGLAGINQYLVDKVEHADDKTQFLVAMLGAMTARFSVNTMADYAASAVVEARIVSLIRQEKLSVKELEEAQERFFCPITKRALQQFPGARSGGLDHLGNDDNGTLPVAQVPLPDVLQTQDMHHPAVFNQVLFQPKVQKMHDGLKRMDDTLQALAERVDLTTLKDHLNTLAGRNRANPPDAGGYRTAAKGALIKNRKSIGRKVLKRSMTLFKQLIGANELKAFMGESGLTVQGHYFDYQLKRNDAIDLVDNAYAPTGGHIPYQLTLIDKDSGLEMADLCVYFRDTPALDQVAALLMHLQSGEEQAILSKANLFNIRPDFQRVMEKVVTDIPEFDRKAEGVIGRQNRPTEDSRFRIPGADSHPGHQLHNEHIDEIRKKMADHFRERLELSPMMKALMDLGDRHEPETVLEQLAEHSESVYLATFCKDTLKIEWTAPTDSDMSFGPAVN